MLIPVQTLIGGVIHTLKTEVLSAVQPGFARGQLFAALDVLQNLQDRVEEKAELHTAEADSAQAALAKVATVLRDAGATDALAQVEAPTSGAPAAPPHARSAAVRAALVQTLDALEGLPTETADAARAAIGEHLAVQAMRDVAILKPSMLNEISKG